MSDLHEAFTKAKSAEAEKESADLKCTDCRRDVMHCECVRRVGLSWLKRDASGV